MSLPACSRPLYSAYDVVVVGARAAGASTAMLLARAGLSVLVLDRGRYGLDTLSTHALMRGGVRQLSRWGLLPSIWAAGTPPISTVTFHYVDDVVSVALRGALCAPRRTVLDPCLVDASVRAGAEVRYGFEVTALDVDVEGRVVGVRARSRRGPDLAVRAGLVIGADGARSVVARLAGSVVRHQARDAGAYVYGYWSGTDVTGYEWAYRPGVTAGFIPTNDGRVCVFVGSTPGRVGRGGREVFDALLAEASPDMASRLAAGAAHGVVRTFPGRPGYLRQAWGPGWALVGDAGSWKDPISTHGLSDALRDAELLARAVVDDTLDGYEAERDRRTRPLLDVADEVVGYRWDSDSIRPLLRSLGDAMKDEVSASPRSPENAGRR
ncbi:NAD(P)/FAD-dependent oxidoreductase [Cryptosporangium sp. NPDC048952]|uniref:NAD(P)/FAD-dependent oxidoreductase n=1 Tax=Cryptosporangium sp. NPDC048952 TaxID=3363961 RepID=UPI00371C5C59